LIIVFMEGKQEAVILNQNLEELIELLRVNNYYCTHSCQLTGAKRGFKKNIYTYQIPIHTY